MASIGLKWEDILWEWRFVAYEHMGIMTDGLRGYYFFLVWR